MSRVEITAEAFYERMGPLDVHPRPEKIGGVWRSTWIIQSGPHGGDVVGVTYSDETGKTVKYEVVQ